MMTLLRLKFRGRILSQNDDVNWSAKSYDLISLDYFLWDYVKGKVYANNPRINELKDKIRCVIGKIEPQINKNV